MIPFVYSAFQNPVFFNQQHIKSYQPCENEHSADGNTGYACNANRIKTKLEFENGRLATKTGIPVKL
jgi:hypothetical protein